MIGNFRYPSIFLSVTHLWLFSSFVPSVTQRRTVVYCIVSGAIDVPLCFVQFGCVQVNEIVYVFVFLFLPLVLSNISRLLGTVLDQAALCQYLSFLPLFLISTKINTSRIRFSLN